MSVRMRRRSGWFVLLGSIRLCCSVVCSRYSPPDLFPCMIRSYAQYTGNLHFIGFRSSCACRKGRVHMSSLGNTRLRCFVVCSRSSPANLCPCYFGDSFICSVYGKSPFHWVPKFVRQKIGYVCPC